MQVDAGKSTAFRSNTLKSDNSLPQDRFRGLEHAEMEQRLDKLNDMRAAVVARGKKLIATPGYPDRKTLRKVAELLAKKMPS